MKERKITHWAPKRKEMIGRSGTLAHVANTPLVQEFVRRAMQSGHRYPAEFSRASGIRQDTLSLFISGKTVLTPEKMIQALVPIAEDPSKIWDYYGCEMRKGRGLFASIKGSERAHNSTVKAHETRRARRTGIMQGS